jgi:hypothetical protein
MSVEDNLLLGAFQRIGAAFATIRTRWTKSSACSRACTSGAPAGRHPVGRRAPDAGHRPRADGQAALLMLDEPSLGLAPRVIGEIFTIFETLRQSGVSILLVEQNARAALQVSDYGYVLEVGEIVLEGSAQALANNPRWPKSTWAAAPLKPPRRSPRYRHVAPCHSPCPTIKNIRSVYESHFPLLLLASLSAAAQADMTVGVILSTTGPGASLGIPERNTVALLPQEIAGQAVKYVVLDDGSDSTAAARNARKLVSENRVDLLIGSTTVPTSAAVAQIAKESKTAQIALAPFAPASGEQAWIFTVAQTNALMAEALIEHMQKAGVKTLAYIGYNDVWGEDWYKVLSQMAPAAGIQLVRDERFNRTDSSVSGQALKVMSSKPDAVLIGATGTRRPAPYRTAAPGLQGRHLSHPRRGQQRVPAHRR